MLIREAISRDSHDHSRIELAERNSPRRDHNSDEQAAMPFKKVEAVPELRLDCSDLLREQGFPSPGMSPMKTASAIALGFSLALVATSCGSTPMQSQVPRSHVDVKDNQPPRPVIQRNPHPSAYEVTVAIKDAPGPFEVVKAAMQYEVLDPACRPDLGGMAGTRASLLEWVPVELTKQGDGTYRGTIYDELLKDEDYFGLGVCHWSLVAVQFKLQAHDKGEDAEFSHHIFHDDLKDGARIKAYFWNGRYPKGAFPGMTVPSELDPSKFKESVRDQLFSIDFTLAKE